MEKVGAQPNLITYSAMIKGYCRMRDIQKAFDILNHMRREGGVRPDEITYNSLLDGCAQNNLVEEGLKLLEEMQQEGVKPSNFTLSVLVKMMSRPCLLAISSTIEKAPSRLRDRLIILTKTDNVKLLG